MSTASLGCFDPSPVDDLPTVTTGGAVTDASGTSGDPSSSGSEPVTSSSSGSIADSTGEMIEECGNGVLDGTEACDDANTEDDDGCSAQCTEEPGFNCIGQPSLCTPIETCGDGLIGMDEQCDDANMMDGDGCTACALDEGYECTDQPSVCSPLCGNGVVADDEGCDDGGQVDGDGCSADCTVELYSRCLGEGPGSCAPIRILYAPAIDDAAPFRMATSTITAGPVEYLDTRVDTPGLPMLETNYDCVFIHPGFEYQDSPTLGATLASFVDSGGNVVLGFAADYPPPLGFGGTPIATADYLPVTTAANVDFSDHTYAGDGASLIHQGVATYSCDIADTGVVLQGMGVQDSTYVDGRIASAYRPDFKVVYLNGTGHDLWMTSGDWPLLVANSCAVGFLGAP